MAFSELEKAITRVHATTAEMTRFSVSGTAGADNVGTQLEISIYSKNLKHPRFVCIFQKEKYCRICDCSYLAATSVLESDALGRKEI